MKVVSTYHSPTSVSFSARCFLTADEKLEFLVVARTSILDVYAVLPDGLQLQSSLDIWSRITSLNVLAGEPDKPGASLLLTTDHPDPRLLVLSYEHGENGHQLQCTSSTSLHERIARPAEFCNSAVVSSSSPVALVSTYVGKLKVVNLSDGEYDSDFDVSVRELNVISMGFLHTSHKREIVAILYRDHDQTIKLTSHELTSSDLSSSPSRILPETIVSDKTAHLIITTPNSPRKSSSLGGTIVAGTRQIVFYANASSKGGKNKRKEGNTEQVQARPPEARVDWPYSEITAWTQVDEEGSRFLLGDAHGHLVLLALSPSENEIELLLLGDVSSPSCLTVLSSQFVFVGSHFGDSQLVRINSSKASDEGYLEIMERYQNIAPIVDAILVDIDGKDQNDIVTCSGGKTTGSLRVIRNGANFTTEAIVDDIEDVVGVWPLKSLSSDEFHEYVLASTPVSTYLYSLPSDRRPGQVTREQFIDIDHESRTIAAANVKLRSKQSGPSKYQDCSLFVQVTSRAVRVVNLVTGLRESKVWTPPRKPPTIDGKKKEELYEIVQADITPSQICVALEGGKIVMLTLEEGELKDTGRGPFVNGDVSAIHFGSLDKSGCFSLYMIVGYWDKYEVQVFSVRDCLPVGPPMTMPSLPRSLLMADLGGDALPFIVIGQSDGAIAVVPFSKKEGCNVSEKKSAKLGDSPVHLSICLVGDRVTVIANGNRSSMVSWRNGLEFTPVLLKYVVASAAINSSAFPNSLVLVTPQGLTFGKVSQLDKLHIRSIPMGNNNPVRIAYHIEAKVFGVGCIETIPATETMVELYQSSFITMDARTFTTTNTYPLQKNEELSTVDTVELSEGRFFAVGTMFYDPNEREATRGRILLFTVYDQENQAKITSPYVAAETEVSGCVFAISSIDGKLVAAVNSGIILYDIEKISKDNELRFTKVTTWDHNYMVTSLAVDGDKLVTGDAVSSVALLRLQDNKFKTLARDYGPLWPLCLSFSEGNAIIGANNDNLFSFKIQQLQDKTVIDQDGDFRIDETVNKFIKGRLSMEDKSDPVGLIPKQVFITSTGRIGVVAETLDDSLSMKITNLLRNLSYEVKGPGDFSYEDWRRPVTTGGRSDAHPIQGYADGDFLQHFLKFEPDSQEIRRILQGKTAAERLTTSYQECIGIIDTIRKM